VRTRCSAASSPGSTRGEDSGNARFARTLFEQALNRQALRLSLDGEQSLDALDREAVMTLTADDIVEAALALGEEPEPEPTPEPEHSPWWRWLV
jgi:stage V sporulation protein K